MERSCRNNGIVTLLSFEGSWIAQDGWEGSQPSCGACMGAGSGRHLHGRAHQACCCCCLAAAPAPWHLDWIPNCTHRGSIMSHTWEAR